MKKHIPQLALFIIYLFRVFIPFFNSFFVYGIIRVEFLFIYLIPALLVQVFELVVTVFVGVGIRSPKTRKTSVYLTLAVVAIHLSMTVYFWIDLGMKVIQYSLFNVPFLTLMVALAILTMCTVGDMTTIGRNPSLAEESASFDEGLYNEEVSN